MISRMRETGMELAIVEGRAGPLVFWGRNEPPPVRSTDVDPGGPDDERDQYLRREPGSGRLDRPTGLIQRRLQVLRTILAQVARAPMLGDGHPNVRRCSALRPCGLCTARRPYAVPRLFIDADRAQEAIGQVLGAGGLLARDYPDRVLPYSAPLASAHVCVAATRDRATARDDAITVHLVVDNVHVRQVYTVRATRIGGAHADPITVGRIAHPGDGRGTQIVVDHPGVLRVANVDATTPFGPTVAVKLVVLEQGLVRAVLVADSSAVTVDHHAVIHPEAVGPGGIVGAANIAPETIPLFIVHVHSSHFELGYPLDGRSVEAQRSGRLTIGEELGVEDTALHVADA
jgi:hypothetical protein